MRQLLFAACLFGVASITPLRCASAADVGFGGLTHLPGDVEASFLINLFRFVAWPHSPSDTATICFLRPSAVQARLETGLSGNQHWARIPGRKVKLRMLTEEEARLLSEATDSVGCQILFLDSRTADQLWPALATSQMPPGLLTVSNQKDFASRGGMIQFLWESSDTYRILINPVNVARADLVVSGALGTLADRVNDARFRNR